MDNLKELLGTVGQDGINFFENRNKSLVNRTPRIGWNSLAKDYLAGRVDLHLHLFLKTEIKNLEGGEYCVIFHRNPKLRINGKFQLNGLISTPVSSRKEDAEIPRRVWSINDSDISNSQSTMFVSIVELVKQPQGMNISTISSMIWLQTINKCSLGRRKVLDTSKTFALIERIGGEDRKFRLLEGSSNLSQGKLPDNIVKTASQVVGDFSDSNSPFRWRGFQNLNPEYYLSGLVVQFRNDGTCLGFIEPLDSIIQGFELFNCPVEFESTAIQSVSLEICHLVTI